MTSKNRGLYLMAACLALILVAVAVFPTWKANAENLPEAFNWVPTATAISRNGVLAASAPHKIWVPAILNSRSGPVQPGNLSNFSLTKGPELLYTGNNTEMKIFWQWTKNSTFQVDWGTDSNYSAGSASVSAYDTTNHLYAITLKGLTPGQKYQYRVVNGGQFTGSSFKAAPSDSTTTLKFISYGDTRTNANQHETVAAQVVAMTKLDPDFQTFNLNVGDQVASGDSESSWANELYAPGLKNIREEMASLAVLPVMGNHEGSGTLFKRYFPLPFVASRYWSFDYGPAHVVMLDQFTAYNAGSAQFNWMKADLAATNKKWKIVVLHMPGWTANGGHSNDVTVQNDLEPIFEQYQVALVLGGHNHYYARASVKGIMHLTVGTGGAPQYSPASGQPDIISTYKGSGFAKFEINGSTMTGWFVSGNGTVRDTFSLTR